MEKLWGNQEGSHGEVPLARRMATGGHETVQCKFYAWVLVQQECK